MSLLNTKIITAARTAEYIETELYMGLKNMRMLRTMMARQVWKLCQKVIQSMAIIKHKNSQC